MLAPVHGVGGGDHSQVDYVPNGLMRPVYDAVLDILADVRLRPDLQPIADAGLVRDSGRVYLRCYAQQRGETAAGMDRWAAERWVNDIHIESSRSQADRAWRCDVLGQALLLVTAVLPGFAALTRQPAQAVIGLQHAPGDPALDYPVGSVHLYQLTRPDDDARPAIEAFAQPVLVITSA
jgi:hypothetical protein